MSGIIFSSPILYIAYVLLLFFFRFVPYVSFKFTLCLFVINGVVVCCLTVIHPLILSSLSLFFLFFLQFQLPSPSSSLTLPISSLFPSHSAPFPSFARDINGQRQGPFNLPERTNKELFSIQEKKKKKNIGHLPYILYVTPLFPSCSPSVVCARIWAYKPTRMGNHTHTHTRISKYYYME